MTDTSNKLLFWNGRQWDKFLIIENYDIQAGFCALVVFVLNGIRKASAINAIPIFDFNGRNTCYFYDESKGDSIWEYFFQPISPFKVQEVKHWLSTGKLNRDDVEIMSAKEFGYLHHHDPHRIATFWAWEVPKDKALWMQEKRRLGREYVRNYIRPKNDILVKVELFCRKKFYAQKVFGVHIRGTDFAYAKPIGIAEYFVHLDDLIDDLPHEDYRIFVATDQQQYLDQFMYRYGNKVVTYNAARSTSHIAPFRLGGISGYQRGEDALMDMLILSRCQHIIKGPAALGEMATWFSNHCNVIDLGLKSEFKDKGYAQLTSAYAELNIDQKSQREIRAHKMKERLVKQLFSWKLVSYFYKRVELVRRWLLH